MFRHCQNRTGRHLLTARHALADLISHTARWTHSGSPEAFKFMYILSILMIGGISILSVSVHIVDSNDWWCFYTLCICLSAEHDKFSVLIYKKTWFVTIYIKSLIKKCRSGTISYTCTSFYNSWRKVSKCGDWNETSSYSSSSGACRSNMTSTECTIFRICIFYDSW